jgi:hypothetical protein
MPSEHKQIKITEVKEPRPVGNKGAVVYEVKGEDGLKYETFSETFSKYFVVDKTLEVDVDTVSNQAQDGNTYVHHRITQVYVDSKPVQAKQGGGRSYGKSPQEIASIENQCRSKIITELWIAGKLKDEDTRVKALLGWLPYTAIPTAESKQASTPSNGLSPVISKPADDMSAPARPANPSELNKLAEAQKKAKQTNTQVLAMIPKEWNITARTDLTQYQAQTLIDKLDKLILKEAELF